MKRTLLGISLLASLLAVGAHWAGTPPAVANAAPLAAQDTDISGQSRLLGVAIPADGQLGDLLRKNAQISGGFQVIPRRSMPSALVKATGFDKKAWGQVGNVDVVILTSEAGSQLRMAMYELSKGDKPVLSKGYPAGDPLSAANKFMNEVVNYYTQEPGVFGSRIAFVRTRREPTISKNVYTVQMNGESTSAVTSNRSLNILPSMGPGGEVVFTSYAKRNPDLWTSNGTKRISKYPGLNLGGAVSPDGGTIALALSKDGNSEIYTIDRSGNIKNRLTKNAAIDGQPSWSGGGQLAFVSDRAGGPQVYRMSASGGGASRVTKSGSYNQSPDWSQGKNRGQWIVYSGRDNSNRYDIFKVDVKTGKVTRMTQSPGRNLDPSWSPDGRYIAYTQSGSLYVANEDGDNNIEIAKGASTPDWGPRAD
ncbi:PD40 domain-containing protein [Pseudenhygromyxa sp. WMMC2535]|uniref:DPP IV N-terminal domain-containing protein n=1 Tax=Pseudenhygromyxa sp. WMMC2535 TaxID=2712867 RepID=UPI001556FDFF|nr:DPP IV N-terminal domain-containing protein [Pseudenhygromyxa sp. WMMC2535]NVB38840.1 PD40 domain-containing protein [Pseudenhygromyxa sp. WMMC2535]